MSAATINATDVDDKDQPWAYSLRGQGLIFGRLRLGDSSPSKICVLRNSSRAAPGRLAALIVVTTLPRDCGVSLARDLRTLSKRRVALSMAIGFSPSTAIGSPHRRPSFSPHWWP